MNPPPLVFGGRSPATAYLRHSTMVVFPLPLWPTITVSGLKNWMIFTSCESKERTPRMASLSNSAIVALNYVVSMMMTVRHKYIQCRQGAARRGAAYSYHIHVEVFDFIHKFIYHSLSMAHLDACPRCRRHSIGGAELLAAS